MTPEYNHIGRLYGGVEGVRNSSNIVFSNGRFDPWRSGGVTSINVTSQSLWSIVIPNGAHHVDLMFTTKDDPPDLAIAREFEVEKMKEWLGISTVVGSSVVATEKSSSSSSADTKEEKVERKMEKK